MKKITLLTLSSFIIPLSGQALAQTNLLANPGFESGLTNWTNNGATSAVKGHAKTGTYAARTGTARGGIQQALVKKLTAGRKYRLTFWAKIGTMSVSSMISIRVKNANGGLVDLINIPISSTSYKQYTKDFTYGSAANSVEVAIIKDTAASSYIYADDFSLTDLTSGTTTGGTTTGGTTTGGTTTGGATTGGATTGGTTTGGTTTGGTTTGGTTTGGTTTGGTTTGGTTTGGTTTGGTTTGGTTTGGTTTGGTTTGGTTTGGTTTGGTTTGGTTTGGTTTGGTTTGGTTTGGTTTGGTTTGGTTTGGTTTGGTTGGSGTFSSVYKPLGVGGGGAMSGVAISPFANLWFVGTDMGTLFRSVDQGLSWVPVNHLQTVFNSDLTRAVSPGFSSDGVTVFHASAGVNPQRSSDAGLTFQKMTNLKLNSGEYIRYWHSDSSNANRVFASTTTSLLVSNDKGNTWTRATGVTEAGVGTFVDQESANKTIYHATKSKIMVSNDGGANFTTYFTPSGVQIRQFAGGNDGYGMTLAFADNNSASACGTVDPGKVTCGFVWVNTDGTNFKRTNQVVGDHLKMAENDSSTIYTTGARAWINQYGTKVHVSRDKGETWTLKLNQMDYDKNYSPWPQDKIEYSAVALDVGWWDNGYESFDINRRNSAQVAGTGYFFLFATLNHGDFWKAPFTEYKDIGTPAPKKKWNTRGLEVISAYKAEFHPNNPNLMYVASADIGGLCSDDKGVSFRVCKAQYNSNYDYSFDPSNDQVVYAAAGNLHDYPNDWRANATTNEGGIYKSINRGLSWTRLTPTNTTTFNRQYLSVAFDAKNNTIYGGSHENGISRSKDGGATWALFNDGLPAGNKIIPQIEVDPRNGNAYALLTGDAPTYSNQASTGVYMLDVANGATSWKLLRGTVNYPKDADAGYKLWYYPTSFAINFSTATSANTIYMTDYENKGNWLMTGVWKSTDNGQTWDRVKQMTHATQVAIDPHNLNNVYASGYYQLDGQWGSGGQMYSRDGGATWLKNTAPTLQQNARGVTPDPTDPSKIIYTYFGGGMLYGSNPAFY